MKIPCLLISCLTAAIIQAEEINVYFAGGQSNAKETWANAAEAEIKNSDPSAVVVWTRHIGSPLREWYTSYTYNGSTGRQQYYMTDFYNPSPDAQGLLEASFQSILDQGDTPILKGLLWFQGESDQYLPESTLQDGYYNEFIGLRNLIAEDFTAQTLPASIAMVWQEDDALNIPLEHIRDQQHRLGLLDTMASYDTKELIRLDTIHVDEGSLIYSGTEMAKNLMAIPEPSSLSAIFLSTGLLYLRNMRLNKIKLNHRVEPAWPTPAESFDV